MSPSLKRNIVLTLILAVTVLLFSPTINSNFLNWDDSTYITNNKLIYNDINIDSFEKLYDFDQNISLVLFSFLVQIKLFGDNPELFNLLNILFHLFNVLLIYKLGNYLLKNPNMAIIIAFIFAIHPLKTESVCWIIQRKDLFFSLFFILSILAYIKYIKHNKLFWTLISLILAYLAILSKVQAITLPFTILLIVYHLRGRILFKDVIMNICIFLLLITNLYQLHYFILLVALPTSLILLYGDKLYHITKNTTKNLFHRFKKFIKAKSTIVQLLILTGSILVLFEILERVLDTIFDYLEVLMPIIIFFHIYPALLLAGLFLYKFLMLKTKKHKLYTVIFSIAIASIAIVLFYNAFLVDSDLQISDIFHKRIFYAGFSFNYYLYKLFLPFNLVTMHPYPDSTELSSWYYQISPLISLFIIGLVIFLVKRIKNTEYKKYIAFGLLFYLINIMVVLHFIPIKGKVIVADRYLYLASFGLITAVICYIDYLITQKTKAFKYPIRVIGVIILLIFSLQTYSRSKVWNNDLSFWGDVIDKKPDNHYAHYSLGLYYYERKLYDKAIEKYNTAIKLHSRDNKYFTNRGACFIKIQKYEKAFLDFKMAIKLNPDDYTSFNNLGVIHHKMGNLEKARQNFKQAIKLKPDYTGAEKNLQYINQLLNSLPDQDADNTENNEISD